jgi:ribosome-binding protein aMBF1 (putative translation factor)
MPQYNPDCAPRPRRMPTIRRISQSYYTPCRHAIQLASGNFGFAMPAKKPGRPTSGTDDTSEGMHVLFGANLRQARLKAKLSQAELAARTGMRQPYISDIENGVRDITLGTMTSCARAVGIDVRMLLKQPRKKK